VTRAAIKNDSSLNDSSLNDEVAGVIHVVQPSSGAPAAYQRFFTGVVRALDGGLVLLGNEGYKFTEIVSGLPGPLQLIPFHKPSFRHISINSFSYIQYLVL
jgi:hypothetical protein